MLYHYERQFRKSQRGREWGWALDKWDFIRRHVGLDLHFLLKSGGRGFRDQLQFRRESYAVHYYRVHSDGHQGHRGGVLYPKMLLSHFPDACHGLHGADDRYGLDST
jgi:hypothetical protein